MNYNYNAYPWGRWIKWIIAAVIALILLACTAGSYNGLAKAKQDMDSKWSQVENIMQSRANKIDNLVEVVKGYVKHEEKVFDDIASARSMLMNSTADAENKLDANDRLVNGMKQVLLIVENYPDLKASDSFHELTVAIDGMENRVSVERMRYIESVMSYNNRVTTFPGNIFAGMMGFEPRKYFEAEPGAKEAPKVKF